MPISSWIRQLTLLVLVVSFLYSSVEYFFVFDYLKESINKEMDDKIESGECGAHLITIAVKKDAISTTHWIRKNKEFFLNGVYYDVAQITETASDFVFLCMNDGKEEALFEHFFDFFEHSPKSKQPRKREPVLNPLYFTDRKACYSYRPYISIVQTSVFSNHYTKVYMEIKYPPPRVV